LSIVGLSTPAFAAVPNSPSNLNFGTTQATDTTISLSWTAPVGGTAQTGYSIEGAIEDHTTFQFGSFVEVVANTGDVTSNCIQW